MVFGESARENATPRPALKGPSLQGEVSSETEKRFDLEEIRRG